VRVGVSWGHRERIVRGCLQTQMKKMQSSRCRSSQKRMQQHLMTTIQVWMAAAIVVQESSGEQGLHGEHGLHGELHAAVE
jgi:uncharacterized protein YbaP (TraB family)